MNDVGWEVSHSLGGETIFETLHLGADTELRLRFLSVTPGGCQQCEVQGGRREVSP